MQGNQRGGAGCVYTHTGSSQIENISDSSSRYTGQIAWNGIGEQREIRFGDHPFVVVDRVIIQSNENARPASGKGILSIPCIFGGLPYRLKQQTLIRRHQARFFWRQSEEGMVEFINFIQVSSVHISR
ncbi:hypothetical protein D3C81_1465110 [compost metagenome]